MSAPSSNGGSDHSLPARPAGARRDLLRGGVTELSTSHPGRSAAALPRPSASVLEIIWSSRWLVLIVAGLFIAGGVVYLLCATPIYSSNSRILVERDAPAIIPSDVEPDASRSKNYLQTQCSVITSTPIVADALKSIDARSLRTLSGVSNPVDFLKSRLLAELGMRDDIITCTLESPYPDEAATLVNAVVASYVRFQTAQRQSTASDVLKFLQTEKATRDKELKRKTDAMFAFKQAHGLPSIADDKGNVVTQRLARLSDEVTDAQLQTVVAAADHEAARAALNGTPARRSEWIQAMLAKGELREMDTMYQRLSDSAVTLEVQLATTSLSESHPRVQATKQMLQQVKEKLAEQEEKLAQAYLAMTARKVEMARSNEAAIQARYDEQEQLARNLNSQMAEYAAMEAEVRQAERYSELLDGRINELMTLQQVPAMNIRVLEPAQASLSPVRPAPVKVLAAALLIGLFCGSGLALGRARMEQRLVSLPEIVSLVNAPVLGAIPYISRSLREDGAVTRAGVQRNPLSEVAEAHRMIRASICYGLSPSRSRTILVTSPASKEGKSTVSSGLAWALCEAGERVLLIDADLRRPVQHSIFNLDGTRGVTDVVAGRLSLNEAIVSSGISGLDILPSGSGGSVPTGIINSEAFADLLVELSHRYDRIVLDSPPAALVADARVLAALTDVTLLVVRMGKTTRKDALRAVHGLVNVGARVRGVIVNVAKSPFSDFYPGGDIYYRHDGDHHSNGSGNGKAARLSDASQAAGSNGNGHGNGSGADAAEEVASGAAPLRPPIMG